MNFGNSLESLDVDECPTGFRTTMLELASAWTSYGEDWLNASRRLSFENLSDDETARHLRRINTAMHLLEDVASEFGLNVPRTTYE